MISNRHSDYIRRLPGDWDRVHIKSLGDVCAGGTPSRNDPRCWNGTIPWVTPSELTQLKSKFLRKTSECITEIGLTSCGTRLLPKGSLLVTTRATIGAVAVSAVDICTNQGFKNIIPNADISVDFYFHLLGFVSGELSRLSSGSTFQEINQKNFESITVPKPRLAEQRRITEILDTFDEAIQKTEALIAKLKAMKQGLLHDLLTRGLDENDNLRDPKAHPEQFKDSLLGKIPKGWEIARFREFVSSSAFGPRFSAEAYDDSGNVATLRTTDMDEEGKLNLDSMPLARLSISAFSSHLLCKDDLLITRSGTCGIVAVFQGHNLPVLPGAFLIRFRLRDRLLPHYICYYFNWEVGRARLLMESEGGVQKNLRGSTILRMLIPVPAENEQSMIVNTLSKHDSCIRTEEQYLEKLKFQKKGLMHDLLTGKVRVKMEKSSEAVS